MRGISNFQKPHYREFRTMRGRPMRGLPALVLRNFLGKVVEHPQDPIWGYVGGEFKYVIGIAGNKLLT